jgi:hypothetical protein
MKGYLKLWLETDGDGTAELFAQFSVSGFAGIGSAWFSLPSLVEHAKLFAQYPLPLEQPVTLEGGYWSSEKPDTLSQEHLHISAYPINGRGGLALRIKATTPLDKDERPQSGFYAAVEMKTNYEDMRRFSTELGSLVRGEICELTLEENES